MLLVCAPSLQELEEAQAGVAAHAAAADAAQVAAWQARRLAAHVCVSGRKQRLAQEAEQERQRVQAAQAVAAAAAVAALAAQRPAVEARAARCREALQQQLEQQQQRREAAAARAQRLAAIAEKLAPQVVRDAARAMQPTLSSGAAPAPADAGGGGDSAGGGAAGFRAVHGYTTDQVLADPRFRVRDGACSVQLRSSMQCRIAGDCGAISLRRAAMQVLEALHRAGLAGGGASGTYVAQVVAGLPGATQPRRDAASSMPALHHA